MKKIPYCTCGHKWERHHHGCVMNIDYKNYPLNFGGVIAQECEQHEVNGQLLIEDENKACRCDKYIPKDRFLRQKAKKWLEDNINAKK